MLNLSLQASSAPSLLSAPLSVRPGHENTYVKAFVHEVNGKKKTAAACKRKVYLPIDEKSLKERRKVTRDAQNLPSVEYMWVITANELDLNTRPLKHFAGTNKAEWMGPLVLEAEDRLWQLPFGQKKDILPLLAHFNQPNCRASQNKVSGAFRQTVHTAVWLRFS